MPAAGRNFNPTQQAYQEAFPNAIAYAKSAKDETIYLTKAQGTTMTAFNAAVADWFNKPEVLEINIDNWTGNPGQTIRVKAQDDTQVAKVHVQITDGTGIVEQGDAVATDGLWWEYTTTASVSTITTAKAQATAHDLPGNNHMLTWQNN
jgi:broad specificity polyphosphatase/5'/3'-nucleotidase SurE